MGRVRLIKSGAVLIAARALWERFACCVLRIAGYVTDNLLENFAAPSVGRKLPIRSFIVSHPNVRSENAEAPLNLGFDQP